MMELLQIRYFTPLCGLFFVVLVLREYFAFKTRLAFKYFFTPAVTFCIILFVLLSIHVFGLTQYGLLILLGLSVSLVADTLLMIEEISLFKNGLVFFLLTHCFYIAAFSLNYRFEYWHLFAGAVLFISMAVIYNKIYKAGKSHNYWVLLYMVILSSMSFLAFSYLGSGSAQRAVLLPVGAALFVISDSILGINTFVKRIPHSTVFTWSFYAPAQFLIALSCFF